MTPREYYRESEAARQRAQDESDRDVVLAWRTGSFAAQAVFGKLPDLHVAVAKSRGGLGWQTVTQQLAQLKTLSKTFGYPLHPVSEATLAKLHPMRES
jgi:hypothetical protein